MFEFLCFSNLGEHIKFREESIYYEDVELQYHKRSFRGGNTMQEMSFLKSECPCYLAAYYNSLSIIVNGNLSHCIGNTVLRNFNLINAREIRNALLFNLPNMVMRLSKCFDLRAQTHKFFLKKDFDAMSQDDRDLIEQLDSCDIDDNKIDCAISIGEDSEQSSNSVESNGCSTGTEEDIKYDSVESDTNDEVVETGINDDEDSNEDEIDHDNLNDVDINDNYDDDPVNIESTDDNDDIDDTAEDYVNDIGTTNQRGYQSDELRITGRVFDDEKFSRKYTDVLRRLILACSFVYTVRRPLFTDKSISAKIEKYFIDYDFREGTGVYLVTPDINNLIRDEKQFVYLTRSDFVDVRLFKFVSDNGWYAYTNLVDISNHGWKRVEYQCKLIDGINEDDVYGVLCPSHAEFVADAAAMGIQIRVNDKLGISGMNSLNIPYTMGLVDSTHVSVKANKMIDLKDGGVHKVNKIYIHDEISVLAVPYGSLIYGLPHTSDSIKDDDGNYLLHAVFSRVIPISNKYNRYMFRLLVYRGFYDKSSKVRAAFREGSFRNISHMLVGNGSANIYSAVRNSLSKSKFCGSYSVCPLQFDRAVHGENDYGRRYTQFLVSDQDYYDEEH